MKNIEKGSGELVVSRGDGTVDLEMSYHALDLIALPIDASIPSYLGLAIGFGRNAGADTGLLQALANGVSVIAFIGEEIGRLLVGQCHHVFERGAVRRFARCEMEDEREPSGITETMNFTGEPAPRAAKSLFASPPFAPAAET